MIESKHGQLKEKKNHTGSNYHNGVFCNVQMESSKHLLFYWSFAHYIWTNGYLWYGDIRVLPNDCVNHF